MDVENKAPSTGEKGSQSVTSVEAYLDVIDRDKVHRKLFQRHIQMCVVVPPLSLLVHPDTRKGWLYDLARSDAPPDRSNATPLNSWPEPSALVFSSYVSILNCMETKWSFDSSCTVFSPTGVRICSASGWSPRRPHRLFSRRNRRLLVGNSRLITQAPDD